MNPMPQQDLGWPTSHARGSLGIRVRTITYSKTLLIVALASISGWLSEMAFAQQARPLPVESALSVRSFGDLSSVELSPDGKWLAYVVKDDARAASQTDDTRFRTGIPLWARGDDIYISDTETGASQNLTGGMGESWLPSWSSDGHYLAFISSRDGTEEAKPWVWDSTRNELRKISDARVRTDQIEWTLDSRRIIVTVVPDSLSVEQYVAGVQFHSENPTALGRSVPGSTVTLYGTDAAGRNQADAAQSDPWNLNVDLRDLSSIEVLTGESELIVRGHRIATYQISSDGTHVAYTIPKRFERPGSQQILFDLATVMTTSRQERVVASGVRLDYDGAEFSWSPNDLLLVYHAGGPDEKVRDCYVASVDGRAPRNITRFASAEKAIHSRSSVPLWDETGNVYFIREAGLWTASVRQDAVREIARVSNRTIVRLLGASSSNSLWRTSGGKATVVVTHDDLQKQDGFYEVELVNGRSKKLLETRQCFTCEDVTNPFAVAADGRSLAYIAEDTEHAPDLWFTDGLFRHTHPLTHLNLQLNDFEMGSSRLVSWLSDDGRTLSGALLLPSGFREGIRYPLVVWVYAGTSFSDRLNRFGLGEGGPFNFQLLATRGYAVLLPDSPQGQGEPMQELAKTVFPGVNEVIRLGIADPDRLAVMGQSNGGYSTLALLVQTNRFKAAVEMDGMADLIGLYGEMDKTGAAFGTSLEQGFDAMGGTLWQVPEKYVENSPLFYFDRIETPLLIIHGGADTAVAPSLGDQIFVSLRRLGRDVQYAKYEGEGHSQLYWSHANQVDVSSRVIAWLDTHLAPKPN